MPKVLFSFFYPDYRELEWAQPIIWYLRQHGFSVEVLLPLNPGHNRQHQVFKWLKNNDVKVVIANDVFVADNPFLKFFITLGAPLENKFNWYHQLFKQLVNPTSYFHNKISWAGKRYINLFTSYFRPVDYVFITPGAFENCPKYSMAGIVARAVINNKTTVVEYPLSAINVLRKSDRVPCLKIENFGQTELSPSLPSVIKYFHIGILRYTKDWVENLKAEYATIKELKDLKANSKPKILVGLKNRTSYLKALSTEKELAKIRGQVLKDLINDGYFPIVKPHPGIQADELTLAYRGIDPSHYKISDLPLTALTSCSDYVAFEMVSSGIFEVIAAGKPVIWLGDYFINQPELNSRADVINKLISLGIPKQYFDFIRFQVPKNFDTLKGNQTEFQKLYETMHIAESLSGALNPVKDYLIQIRKVKQNEKA